MFVITPQYHMFVAGLEVMNKKAIFSFQIVTNAGRASTLVASDAAAPTFRRIERAAIAAATSISYPSR